MKFIDSQNINNAISELMYKYKNFKWTLAWAGFDFHEVSLLKKYSSKITRLIIGTHFYQTDPRFIKEFYKNKNVRFILNPTGIFHPKIYLFENGTEDWAAIIGSHNFTKSAFSLNTEASILITSKDLNSIKFKNDIDRFIDESWSSSKKISDDELEKYTKIHKKQSKNLVVLSSKIKDISKDDKLILEIQNLTWEEYYKQISHFEFNYRIKLLDEAKKIFQKYKHFRNIPTLERKGLGGFYNNDINVDGFNWYAFGNMRGSGRFMSAIKSNNTNISKALDSIPLKGPVKKSDFENFFKTFRKFPPGAKNPLSSATRLLAMKRPDYFFCIDSKNKNALSTAFNIKKNVNHTEYWDLILERIYQSDWWNDKSPKNGIEKKAFNYRVALIDNLYFEV